MKEKGEEKILRGPWKGTPVFHSKDVVSIEPEQKSDPVSMSQVNVVPAAPSGEFLRIVASSRKEDILPSKISDQIKQYNRWSREQLLLFVNNPQNHPVLIQKPALVLALHMLIEQKRQ